MNKNTYSPKRDNKRQIINLHGVRVNGDFQQISFFDEHEQALMWQIHKDLDIGRGNIHECRQEFSDKSLFQMYNILRKKYDAYQEPYKPVEGEEWIFNTIRPLSRIKIMGILSHEIAERLVPSFYAMDSNSYRDDATADVLSTITEYLIKASGPRGIQSYLHNLINACVLPASIQHFSIEKDEYVDISAMQVKLRQVPLLQFWISSNYISNVQDQRFVVENYIQSYESARKEFCTCPKGEIEEMRKDKLLGYRDTCGCKFDNVQPGLYTHASIEAGFASYKNYFAEEANMVLRQDYYNKELDMKCSLINGVMMEYKKMGGNPYPYLKTIYQDFADTNNFYGMSLNQFLLPASITIDTLYNAFVNSTILTSYPSLAYQGEKELNAREVFSPLNIVQIERDEKLSALYNGSPNNGGLVSAMQIEEGTMTQASMDKSGMGAQEKYVTAEQTANARENLKKALGLFGRQVEMYVMDLGDLIANHVIKNFTYKYISDTGIPVYHSFFSPFKEKGVQFKIQNPTSEEEELNMAAELAMIEADKGIKMYSVNPVELKNYKYRIYINAEANKDTNSTLERLKRFEEFDRLANVFANDPAKLDIITKEVLMKNYSDDLTKKLFAQTTQPAPAGAYNPPAVNGQMLQNLTGTASAKSAVAKA